MQYICALVFLGFGLTFCMNYLGAHTLYVALLYRMSSSDTTSSETECRSPMESSEDIEGGKAQEVSNQKGKKRKWNRGRTMTAAKRARQFPEVMEVRGEAMWCIACDCPVAYKDKCIATQHCKSAKHKINVQRKAHVMCLFAFVLLCFAHTRAFLSISQGWGNVL